MRKFLIKFIHWRIKSISIKISKLDDAINSLKELEEKHYYAAGVCVKKQEFLIKRLKVLQEILGFPV